jgi:3-oxoacyl-[acyl-carrier-protein] synthase II
MDGGIFAVNPRVVITGIGICSPIGTGAEEFTEGLESGCRGIGTITHYDADGYPIAYAAEAKKRGKVLRFPPKVDRKERFIREAFYQLFKSGDPLYSYLPEDRLLNLGTGIDYFDIEGYVNSGDAAAGRWPEHCKRSLTIARDLAEDFDLRGGCTVNLSACVASTQALGLSFRMLKQLKGKAVVTGGADSMLNPLSYMGFYKLGAFSQWKGESGRSCRPFDRNRCGLVIGEGAAAFLLERLEDADPDKIQAEIAGYASTMDSYMITDPQPEGAALARAALEAIEVAGITPEEIDSAHLHETGTLKNAPAEAKAMEKIFGKRFSEIPVFSLKGQTGHLIGACGAIEVVAAIHSLRTQTVLPTVNFEDPDTEVPLRVIRDAPLHHNIEYILKLNSAFGGQNAALVMKRYHA